MRLRRDQIRSAHAGSASSASVAGTASPPGATDAGQAGQSREQKCVTPLHDRQLCSGGVQLVSATSDGVVDAGACTGGVQSGQNCPQNWRLPSQLVQIRSFLPQNSSAVVGAETDGASLAARCGSLARVRS